MWLLRLFPVVARAAASVYYRISYAGGRIPPSGPVLLVANHPNSLLDPTLVVAAARRPVRFLAKAPLFSDRAVGWLVRGAGAIPVHRRADDPSQMDRNAEMFAAVHRALGRGDAVGIFPEGASHSEPSLAPLRSGAARLALGAFPLAGDAFPIVPLGLVLREKDAFRSEAQVIAGSSVPWADLAPRGLEDAEAVKVLTGRIAEALRRVTLNLEQWEDRPLVEGAVGIWEAERGAPDDPGGHLERLALTTNALAAARRAGDPRGSALGRDLRAHLRRLDRLGLRPSDLRADVGLRRAVAWALPRLLLLVPLAATLGVAGYVLFLIPYRLTGRVARALRPDPDVAATVKMLAGVAAYSLWVVALGAAAGLAIEASGAGPAGGWLAALATLLGVPAIGMGGLLARERWRGSWRDARRFFLLRSRRDLIAHLAARQRALVPPLETLRDAYADTAAPANPEVRPPSR